MDAWQKFIEEHPHNTDCSSSIQTLVHLAYRIECLQPRKAPSIDAFVELCVDAYGGTIADAMIRYLENHVG